VFGTILFRMILWDLVKVFLIALVTITGILLLAGIIAEASQQGLGPSQILAAIPLLIPSTLPYTIPATTLFATCVVYGRMSADNEILAIKSAGINLVHVVGPGLLLGVVMSGVTLALYVNVIPYSHHLLRAMIFDDADELLYSVLRRQQYLGHSNMPFSMWVKGVQGRKLISPTFKRHDKNGQTDVVVVSREAYLHVDMGEKKVYIDMRYGELTDEKGDKSQFDRNVLDVPLPPNFGADANKRARDMTWNEILDKREEYRQKKDAKATEIALAASEQLVEGAPESLPEHVKHLRNEQRRMELEIRLLDVELLMRPALSIGCLCFILVGCPVGIWMGRADYLSSFIICFLPIVVVYYPLMLCGTGMAKDGKFNPLVLVWAANILVGVVGVGLFWKLLRN
jgi:lipopolysaccharide export system permease protein